MRKLVLVLFCFMISLGVYGEWVSLDRAAEGNLITYLQDRSEELEITFTLDGYELELIEYEGRSFQRFSHPAAGDICQPGKPDLPVFTALFSIPAFGEAELEITSEENITLEEVLAYPRERLKQDGEEGDFFEIDDLAYLQKGMFPAERVNLAEPVIMRDLRVLPVTFSPFRYNAAERKLEVITELTIKIKVSGNGGTNCQKRQAGTARSFEPLYEAMVHNYSRGSRTAYQQPALLFIAPDDANVLNYLQYLADWKRQKGFEVTIANTSETGTGNADIKAYLQNAYDNWENPPEYVCLLGDADGDYAIPTWFYYGTAAEGDHPYSQLAGNDFLADVHLGRLSYVSLDQLTVLLSKILYYEMNPNTGYGNWLEKALLVADPAYSGYSTITTTQGIKEMLLNYPENWNDDEDIIEVYAPSFPTQMNQALNAGVSIMFYRGFLGLSGWTAAHINGLNNVCQLPFATILTCASGNFYNTTGISETFTRLGTTSNPAGAIGAVGESTSNTHTCFNNAVTLGMASGFLQHDIYSMGAILTMGKYYLSSLYPQNPEDMVNLTTHYCNLMGDPSLEIWTAPPGNLLPQHAEYISEGDRWLEITVCDEDGAIIENAWVTLTAEDTAEFMVTAFSEANGEVLLPLPELPPGNYTLTVSKHNYFPYQAVLPLEQAEVYLDISEIVYLETSGNGDGQMNPGESFALQVTLTNFGLESVTGVTATLSCESELILVNEDTVDFSDIPPEGSSPGNMNFSLTIAPAAFDCFETILEFHITGNANWENEAYAALQVRGASLWLSDYLIQGDGILNPGETEELCFTLGNSGILAAENVTGTLSCRIPGIEILSAAASFSQIPAGGSASNTAQPFIVHLSENIVPGLQIPFLLQLSSPAGYSDQVSLLVPAGALAVTDPFGPDAFGYYCFDDGDLGYALCPQFNWIEINPNLGGEGICLDFTGGFESGQSEVIALPADFHFRFYGEEYELLTISSDGWIAPGYHETAAFMNWFLPSPQGPSPMIAVFWDDLDMNDPSGKVCYFYDPEAHIFIVEWSNVRNAEMLSPETFQVILYDFQQYPTYTDDSNILMQYSEINNTNAGNYPVSHGQYCTIGLENTDSTIGLQYTFNNIYSPANKPLEHQMSLLFTTSFQGFSAPYLKFSDIRITAGDDEFLEGGESVSIFLELTNAGQLPANNIVIEGLTGSSFLEMQNSTSCLDFLDAGDSANLLLPITFLIAGNVPDYYEFELNLNVYCDEYFWERKIPLTAYQPNTFSVNPDSLYLEMDVNQTTSHSFTLTNCGLDTVDFYLQIEELLPAERDISGAEVNCSTVNFTPGERVDWVFTILNPASATEWISDLWLEFPSFVCVNSATNGTGGSGGALVWDGVTGCGTTINWHGSTSSGWGVVHQGETAEITLNVTLREEIAGDFTVNWELQGDGTGNPPHNVSGEIEFLFPIRWINANSSCGQLTPGENREIVLFLDTNNLGTGIHEALITVTTDSWDTKRVPVTLNVYNSSQEENLLPSKMALKGNFPNPFNPSTEISFDIAEPGYIELKVFNLKGQLVQQLIRENLNAGKHRITWNGNDEKGIASGSGIYLYQLSSAETTLTGKMILLK